jgi:hypothetical protein
LLVLQELPELSPVNIDFQFAVFFPEQDKLVVFKAFQISARDIALSAIEHLLAEMVSRDVNVHIHGCRFEGSVRANWALD